MDLIKKLGGETKQDNCQTNYPAGPAFSSDFCRLPEDPTSFDCLIQPMGEEPLEEKRQRLCYCQFLKGTCIRCNQYKTKD